MKQETGRTCSPTTNILSIQCTLNGLFFYKKSSEEQFIAFDDKDAIDNLIESNPSSKLRICVVATKFVMMPDDLYDPSKDGLYLTAKGISLSDQDAVLSIVSSGIRFIMVVSLSMNRFLSLAKSIYDELLIDHPLSKSINNLIPTSIEQIHLFKGENSLFISYYKGSDLLFAECFELYDDKMSVNLTNVLIDRFKIKKPKILLMNDFNKKLAPLFNKKSDLSNLALTVFYK